MATKTFCDRCGDDVGERHQGNPSVNLTLEVNSVQQERKKYDLCKVCLQSFRQWIEPPRGTPDV
jgi:hypothetical protein